MDKFFAILGKIILILLVLGALVGVGYYLGKGYLLKPQITPTPTVQPTGQMAIETPTQSLTSTSLSPTLAPTTKLKKKITAGLPPSSGLSYSMYQLEFPDDWIDNYVQDKSVPTDTLILTKGSNQIKIYQAATGGALCLYPGDPTPEGPSASYTTFVEITTAGGKVFRRSGSTPSGSKMGFTICQKSPSGDYQQPTPFGHISLTLPTTYDPSVLQEMDEIIASMKAI